MSKYLRSGSGRLSAAVVMGAAFLLCTLIGARTIVRVKSFGRTISVTGAAFKPIRSDYALWEGVITTRATEVDQAYAKLGADMRHLQGFLARQNLDDTEYRLGSVSIRKQMNRDRQIIGYELSRSVSVEFDDVDRIRQLAIDASTLIEKGVMIESRAPSYLFTGLDALKIEMIKAATENARVRAEQLAQTTGRTVGAPTSARVGVFQIRPLHSQEVSSWGISDVTTIDKEIVSTVHVDFLIE